MHRVAAVLLGAFVALAGCSPTAAWSKRRLQSWAERSFPIGSSRGDVRSGLKERRIEFVDGQITRGTPTDQLEAQLRTPVWWGVTVTVTTFSEPLAGVRFRFNDRDRLEAIESWKRAEGL